MRRHFITSTTMLLIFLWVYTGLSKLIKHHASTTFLTRSPFRSLASEMAVAVPVIELALAAGLITAVTHLKALKASLILLVLFTLYILYMLFFFPNKPCNCGGVINTMSWTQHIIFNLFFIIITTLSIKWYRHKDVDQPGHAEHPPNK